MPYNRRTDEQMATIDSPQRSSGAAIGASAASVLAAVSTQVAGGPRLALIGASITILLGVTLILASVYLE